MSCPCDLPRSCVTAHTHFWVPGEGAGAGNVTRQGADCSVHGELWCLKSVTPRPLLGEKPPFSFTSPPALWAETAPEIWVHAGLGRDVANCISWARKNQNSCWSSMCSSLKISRPPGEGGRPADQSFLCSRPVFTACICPDLMIGSISLLLVRKCIWGKSQSVRECPKGEADARRRSGLSFINDSGEPNPGEAAPTRHCSVPHREALISFSHEVRGENPFHPSPGESEILLTATP